MKKITIKNPHQVSAIAEINENGIYNTWKISVPRTIKMISIIPIVNATTNPGINAENEFATPDGTDNTETINMNR